MGGSELDGRSAELVGRGPECAAIDRLLENASQSRSGSVVLRGEAGMGKTALLGYAADRAGEMRVLRVTGVEAESDLAFAGLHGLVWPIVDELRHLHEPQRGALGAALGLARGEGQDRFLVSAGVLSLLAAAAEATPIVCLVDDAQWLDVPSADALVFTARRLVAEGVVMLFGAREGEQRRFEGPGLEQLIVGGLDRTSAVSLLDRCTPRTVAVVRERLLAEAAGNPLALLELPAGLSDAQLAGRETLPEALPLSASLRAVFTQRIERLQESTRAALLVAAAEDTGELRVILGAAAQLGLAEDVFDPAQAEGLVHIDGVALSFRHPLVRSAVYESAPIGQRQRTHAALADALSAEQHPDRAVWHQARATLTADATIAAALEASGRRSQGRGGHASAASAFERAAELSDGESSRAARVALAVEAAYVAGQANRARALINRSLPLADRAQRARLLYVRGAIEGRHGWLDDGITALHEAATLSESASLTLEILLEAAALTFYAGDYDAVVALALRAQGVSCETDAERFILAAVTAVAAEIVGDHDRGAVLAAEAIELAERLDDPVSLVWAAWTAARAGEAADGLPYASRAVGIARERGLMTALAFALQMQADRLIGDSRFDLAYATAEEGWRLALDIGQPWAASWNLANVATVDALRGDEQSARAHAAELHALVATSGATLVIAHLERALGLLDLGRGRPGEALDRLLVAIAAARYESHPLFVLALPDAVEAAVRADRLREVAEHLDSFQSWVQRFPNRARLALLARCRALIEESDAERHFVQAIELADVLSPFDRARTELLYGEWLRRQRRRVDARRHLRAALEQFQQLAVAPWEARARSELRASGETARKRDPSTSDQLTPQELQIARLVADGKTNPEVAAELFLSPRTIDYHLRKVFAKLEIASRADLAGMNLGEPAIA